MCVQAPVHVQAAVRNFNRFAYMANGGLLKKRPGETESSQPRPRAENETGQLGAYPKVGVAPN